ncbi:MAG TPA: LysR family transcriptional regulator [Clostridia bacterium]|nr:LysR family transcriptional regulator [Clostridia bacterium]
MEWQQLEYFQTVANLQHMTLAAETLKLSQPALSRSISRLENELGVPLFDRQGRSIVLNRYGKRFLKHVNRILYEYEESKREIQDLVNPEKGEVSLGFLHTIGAAYVPDLIKGFSCKYPGIKFQLHQNSTHTLLNELISGEIDLCMLSSTENMPKVEWNHLWSEELFVAVPSSHRLAVLKAIDLEQIANEPLISFKKGYGMRKITDELFNEAGIKPKITFEGEEVHTVTGLVAAGLGVAFVPDAKGMESEEISLLHVQSCKCTRDIGIVRLKESYLSPSVILFWQYVIEHFRGKSK